MKKYFIPLIAIFLFSCNSVEKETTGKPLLSEIDTFKLGNKIFFIDSSSKTEFNALPAEKLADPESSESIMLAKDSPLVNRRDDTLFFSLTNGGFAKLPDYKADSDSFVSYKYLGRMHAIDQFVCLASFYEGYSYILVNGSTGDTTFICGTPSLSPDHKTLIAGNVDLEAAFSYNGFEMFSIQGNKLKQIGARMLNKWGPNKVKWKTNNELLVERISPGSASQETEKTDYIMITIK